MPTKRTYSLLGVVLLAGRLAIAQAPGNASQGGKPKTEPNQSPAASPRPKPAVAQTFSAREIREGESLFGAQCGFCHGRDADGGESGPDLTRSELVAQDERGDKIGPLVRAGRKQMPAFKLSDAELNSIVAFLHTQMEKFASLAGGRRSVEPEDLETGNAAAGERYFYGIGGCAHCHSPSSDLAGIAKRFQGLALMTRILYPAGNPTPVPPRATFTLESGQTVVAPLVAEDEFSVTVLDALGKPQTYRKETVKVKIDNRLAAHFEQLGKYTDTTLHDVYAYLNTLK